MSNKSDTPKTDANIIGWSGIFAVDVGFARKLERERNALRERVRELETLLKLLEWDAMRFCPICHGEDNKGTYWQGIHNKTCGLKAILDAAKRSGE